MKNKAWLILCIITVIAGVALGCTNLLTKDSIAEQEVIALNAARTSVMAAATEFVEETLPDSSPLTSLHRAAANGETLGYVGQTTVQGFGGPIVVVMGVDINGTVTVFLWAAATLPKRPIWAPVPGIRSLPTASPAFPPPLS